MTIAPEDAPLTQRLGWWSHALLSLARQGLHFSDNPYDRDRYNHLLTIAAEMRSTVEGGVLEEVEAALWESMTGTVPVPVVDGAVFDDAGRILLVQRHDDGLWAMPGGALEVGETPAEGACRETLEETGIVVRARALVGVYDSRFCGTRSTWQLYHFVLLCAPVSGEPRPSYETLDARWFDPDALPPLSPGHPRCVADAVAFYRTPCPTAAFDPVP
ncbi:MAG: NUDIX hydrolase N-terminal domain-containing protein [Anaerolineae bacterium]